MTKAEELIAFLRQNPVGPFVPFVCREGDSLTVYWKKDADYAESISPDIWLFRSIDTHEVVGCRVAIGESK